MSSGLVKGCAKEFDKENERPPEADFTIALCFLDHGSVKFMICELKNKEKKKNQKIIEVNLYLLL